MPNDRDTAITRVANKLVDLGTGASQNTNTLLSDTEIGEEVDAAVVQYSVDRPREVTARVNGTDGSYYATSGLTGWVDYWSRVLMVETPVLTLSATETTAPTFLDPATLRVVWDETQSYVYLGGEAPNATDDFRITYTAPHTLTNATDTIPAPHFDAVCDLAAAYCARRLASKFAKSADATLMADAVNYRDSQLRFRQVAEDFESQYRRKVGLPADGGPSPGNAFANWNTGFSVPWVDRLTHPARWR